MTSIGAGIGNGNQAQVQTVSAQKSPEQNGVGTEQGPPAPGTPEYQALFPNSGVEEIHDWSTLQPDPNRKLWV